MPPDPQPAAVARTEPPALVPEEPFVNRRDPARALGPDGKPAISRRAPLWADVSDEQWNDWRWQLSRQVIPLGRELRAFTGMMEDSLAEDRHSPVPGLVHRYPDRVLMLVTTQCASYCRYCTRSRIVGDATQNFNRRDHEAQLEYLRRTPQIRDVLISGGRS